MEKNTATPNTAQQKGQLRIQLRKTLSSYAQNLSVHDVLTELQRLREELTQIALQTTDSGKAVDGFTLDAYGTVQKNRR